MVARVTKMWTGGGIPRCAYYRAVPRVRVVVPVGGYPVGLRDRIKAPVDATPADGG
jgi:hypothetical protein